MASNINVSVTADATQLRAQLALAQQDLRTYSAALRQAAADIKTSGSASTQQAAALDQAATAYNKARGEVSSYTQQLRQVTGAHESVAHSAGVTREALVMLHETAMGNYTRLAGSTMVIAERTNALHLAMQALTGPMGAIAAGALAVAGGMAFLAIRAHEAAVALREVGNEAVLMGRSGPQAQAAATGLANSLKDTGIVGHAAAYSVAGAIENLTNVTEQQKEKINALAPGFFIAFSNDAEKTVKQIGDIFASDTSLKSYLDRYKVLSTGQMEAWANASTAEQRYQIGIDALSARLDPVIAKFKEQNDAAKSGAAFAGMMGEYGPIPGGSTPLATPPTGLGDFEPGTTAPNAQQAQDTATVIKYSEELRKQKELTDDLAAANRRLADARTAGDASGAQAAQAAIQNIQTQLANLKAPGDSDWASKIALQAKEAGDAAVIAAHNASESRLQITEAGVKAEMAVYKAASEDMTRTDAERTAAKRQYIDLEMSLVKQQAGAEATSARQAYEAKIAEYDQEIAAAKGNAQQIIELEGQKLAFIKQTRGASSADYARAQKEETAAVAAAASEQIKIWEEAGNRRIADQRQLLAQEAALHQVTRAEEAQQLQQFVAQTRDSELQQVNDLLAGLDRGTIAYSEALQLRAKLLEDFKLKNDQIQTEIDTATQKSADTMTKVFTQAFDQIGSTAERALTSYITYQTTWQKAEQEVARSVVTTFISAGTTMVERWLVTQLAMTAASSTQNAIRNAQAASPAATGFGTLLASWIGLESSKTAVTEGAASVRATADSGGGFLAEIGSMLARWLGLETAKTGATTTAAATRTTADTAAATQGTAAMGVLARAEIAAAAAVAAAWAFADSAATGPQGLAAAPGIAAGAEATVMGFQTLVPLDVGAYNVPQDMDARIHKGEMVVPETFASGIRTMMTGDTNNVGGANHFTYAPTFHGAGPSLAAQARNEFDNFSAAVMRSFSNGQLRLPGRA